MDNQNKSFASRLRRHSENSINLGLRAAVANADMIRMENMEVKLNENQGSKGQERSKEGKQ